MAFVEWLVKRRARRAYKYVLLLLGIEIPAEVEIGSDLTLVHRGMGTVVHPRTVLGDRVTIYHQVTLGRADAYLDESMSAMERIEVRSDVILFPGCKILGGPGVTTVGEGTIVAANAVLTKSTGEWEIWAGIPAKRIGFRERS